MIINSISMKESFKELAIPLALVASLAGCSTLKSSIEPEAAGPNCPEDFSPVEGACLSTIWNVKDALEWRCEDRGGEVRVSKVANSPTWVCDVGDGEVFWGRENNAN